MKTTKYRKLGTTRKPRNRTRSTRKSLIHIASARRSSPREADWCRTREVSDAHLARIVQVDLQSDLFAYQIDETALARAQLMDGKLMLVTNASDMSAANVVQRYKALADIERGFRVLKSEIEIAPVFHRLPQRIKAHASICFMALILYRVMRQRLKRAGTDLSPEAALTDLRAIQSHTVSINGGRPVHGVSTLQPRQAQALAALKIKKPTLDPQLPLL